MGRVLLLQKCAAAPLLLKLADENYKEKVGKGGKGSSVGAEERSNTRKSNISCYDDDDDE